MSEKQVANTIHQDLPAVCFLPNKNKSQIQRQYTHIVVLPQIRVNRSFFFYFFFSIITILLILKTTITCIINKMLGKENLI